MLTHLRHSWARLAPCKGIVKVPRREAHYMSTLYGKEMMTLSKKETLGVGKDASVHDIEEAYLKLKMYFDPSVSSDPDARYYFNELTR